MKRIILICIGFFTTAILFAQAPAAFKYQAVARDGSGAVMANKTVSFRMSIIEGTVTGDIVYSEKHNAVTNEFGLVNLEIGNGTVLTGNISGINWGVDVHFLRIEMDPDGGSSFQLMGTSQLLSVPYALHAKTVETGDNWGGQSALTDATLSGNGTGLFPLGLARQGASTGQMLKWNGTTWFPANDNGSNWSINGSSLYYMGGNVGIGKANPTALLQVLTDDKMAFAADNNSSTAALWAGNSGTGPAAQLKGKIKIVDGSEGLGKVLTSDANGLGTWQTAGGGGGIPGGSSGQVQFNNAGAFGGDAGFFWDNTGKKLGLGITSPAYQLSINGGSNFGELQLVNNTTATTGTDGLRIGIGTGTPSAWIWNHEDAELYFGTSNLRRMTIRGDGNIGIGTGSPGGLLELSANSRLVYPHLLLTETESDYARLSFKNTTASTKNWTIAGKVDATDANSLLNFWYWNGTTGEDIMSISGLGRVGIGTYAPNYNLTIFGGTGGSEMNFTNNFTGVTQYDGLRIGTSSSGGNSWVWNNENAKLYFGTNNLERLSILGNGNVGIGDATPDATLDVEGTVQIGVNGVSFSEIREITGTTGSGGNLSMAYPSGYTKENMRVISLEINYNGNSWVGLGGTDAPTTNVTKVFYYLTTTLIYIYYPSVSQFQSKAFRMLVMKVE